MLPSFSRTSRGSAEGGFEENKLMMALDIHAFPFFLSDASFFSSSSSSSSSSFFSGHHPNLPPSSAAGRGCVSVNPFLSCIKKLFVTPNCLFVARSSPRFLPIFTQFSPNFNLASSAIDDKDAVDGDLYESFPFDDCDDSESGALSGIGAGEGVLVEINNLGNNSRRIVSTIHVVAPLQTLWNILTDYERLADFIPGLATCQLLEKTENYARLFQVGQQNLAFGLKFNAKGIVDCYEKQVQILPSGKRRDIEFKMIDGDFEVFEGKWSIEQLEEEQKRWTTLSYMVDVKPKLWLPVQLVERRICKEIEMNLKCIRDEAHRLIRINLHTH